MLKVKWDKDKIVWKPGHRNLTWINKNEKTGEWEMLYNPSSCRTYLNCYWWSSGGNGRKHPNYELNISPLIKDEPAPAEDYTGIFFTYNSTNLTAKDDGCKNFDGFVNLVKKNLEFLHQWEEENGLEKTQILASDDPTGIMGIIFIGDKAWRSCLWKVTLYSYLLKRTTLASFIPTKDEDYWEGYWKELNKEGKLHKLLSKVKTVMKEHYGNHTYESIHVNSGFYSICTGVNPKMAKLLLGEEKLPKTKVKKETIAW